MKRPNPNEYNPYFQRYVDLVEVGDFDHLFSENTAAVLDFYSTIPEDKHDYRYEEGKWTVKDILMHVTDTERLFSYRAFVCIRRDITTNLQTMDENQYAANVDLTNMSLENCLEEFLVVRDAFSSLYSHTPNENLAFTRDCAGFSISARALGYITIGHSIHHMKVIEERYL